MFKKITMTKKLRIKLLENKVFSLEGELDNHRQYLRNAYKKFGRVFQMWAPLSQKFTQEERDNFVFINSFVDGVIFKKDEIVFIEFKTNGAVLTENQKRIRDIIKNKKVTFREVRFK